MEPIYKHEKDPAKIYTPINATLESDGKYHLKAGNEGSADTLYIQQFVNRSCSNNTITMTNAKGEVVLTDHMFDLVHADGDSDVQPLTKSFLQTSLLSSSSGYVGASRAYTIIPLKDKANNAYYEDGNYNLKFSYTLMDGSVQEKEYVLEISSSNEDFSVESIASSNDNKELLLNFTTDMAKVTIGDIEGVKRSARQFAFTKADLTLKNNSYSFKAISESYSVSYGSITSDFTTAICSSSLISGVNIKVTSKTNSDGTIGLTIGIYDSMGGVVKLKDPITVSYYIGDATNVKAYDSKGNELESTFDNGYVKIKTTDKKVTISYTGVVPSKDSSSNLIVGLCSALAAIVIVGVAVILVVVKKNKKN